MEEDIPVEEGVVQENADNVAKKPSRNPNFQAAREKAWEARRKQGVISRVKKEQAKAERDAEYAKALAFLNGVVEPEPEVVQPEPVKKKVRTKTKVIELSDSSSSESDSDSDSSIEVVKVVRKPKAKPTKSKPKKKKVVTSSSSDESDDDVRLGGHVAREMLRRRVLQKSADEAIRRLVPSWRGVF